MKYFILAILLAFVIVPVPTSAQLRPSAKTVSDALGQMNRQAAWTKTYLLTHRPAMGGPTISATVPLALIQHLAQAIPAMAALAGTKGLATYAKDQLGDPAYDVIVNLAATQKLMVALIDELFSAFPKDDQGVYLAYQTINRAGVIATRTLTGSDFANAVLIMDQLIASIE